MARNQGLFFNVGDIITGKTEERVFEIDFDPSEYGDEEIKIASPIKGNVQFIPTDGGVLGSFSIFTNLTLVCSLDGDEFEYPMRLEFHHEYRKEPGEDESPISPDNSVNVAPTLWDEIVVNIPMKPVCPRHKE